MPKVISIAPKSFPEYEEAVQSAGGVLAPLSTETKGLIWTDYSSPGDLGELLRNHPQIDWVQLPFAGVDAFDQVIQMPHRFTSAKGSYREPVAEHALALSLALMRILPERARAKHWGRPFAVSLYDAKVLIVGGGGITEELLNLLAPFRADITVIRKQAIGLQGCRTLTFESLDAELPQADLVVITAALTPETRHLFDARRVGLMKPSAYLVNIARGPIIKSEDLISALDEGVIAGAALDVTDPEPLPEGHTLWDAKNILITPHTADTREMVVRLFSERIRENTLAFIAGEPLVGAVSAKLGY